MVYTVKSKKDLSELVEILAEEGVTLTSEDKHIIEIIADTDKDFDIFTNILSFYISHINFEEHLTSTLIKKGLAKVEAETITEESFLELKTSNYFYTFTTILVKEYFKKMNSLNVESFSLFNMKGFKDEVKVFAESLLQLKNEYKQKHDYVLDYLPEEPVITGEGIKDLFTKLRERGMENGLKMEEFEAIHVFQQNEFLQFKNPKGVILDDDFFLAFLGGALDFDIEDSIDNPELFEGMMISSVLIAIFDIKKVVVHSSVTEKAKEILLYNISSLKKESGKRIKVVMCNGCDNCK